MLLMMNRSAMHVDVSAEVCMSVPRHIGLFVREVFKAPSDLLTYFTFFNRFVKAI